MGGEILGAGGLVQSAQPAPDIQLPCDAESGLEIRDVRADCARQRTRSNLGYAISRRGRRSHDHRNLVGSHDSKALASLQDALRRDLHVKVLRQRGAHECRQRVVFEHVEPLHVRERRGTGLRRRCGIAIPGRHGNRRPPVVRAERARNRQD